MDVRYGVTTDLIFCECGFSLADHRVGLDICEEFVIGDVEIVIG
jgi:hypothetical protein